MSRFDLSDFEWNIIKPLLPDKERGVKRVDDRCILSCMFFVLRTGVGWRDLPERRWTAAGVWNRIMDEIVDAYGGNVVMIDDTSVRVHHAAATVKNSELRCMR